MDIIRKSVANKVRSIMKSKGTYNKGYNTVIEILSSMLVEFYTSKDKMTADTLNELKVDIVQYIDSLKLDDKDLRSIVSTHKKQFNKNTIR